MNRGQNPWDSRPHGLDNRRAPRGQVFPRVDTQRRRDEKKVGEPRNRTSRGPRKRGRDRQEANTYGKSWNHQPTTAHEPTKGSTGDKDWLWGQSDATEGDAGNIPRWVTKRRRSAAAGDGSGDSVPGKEDYPPPPADENKAGGLELPQGPYVEERYTPKVESAAPNDQWLLDDYLPTVHLNETLVVSTGAAMMMAPRSEASSNDLSEDARWADFVGKVGRDGEPQGEEGNGGAWGLPALDLWLAGESEPVFPPP